MFNIEKALKFPFKGEGWIKKILVSTGLIFSGIGLFFITGYQIRIIRMMAEENSDDIILPDWNNFKEIVLDSLKLFVVRLVWFIPSLILLLIIAGLMFLWNLFLFEKYSTAIDLSGLFLYIILLIPYFFTIFLQIIYQPIIMGEFATKKTIKSGIDFKNIIFMSKGFFWKNIFNVVFINAILNYFGRLGIKFFIIGIFPMLVYRMVGPATLN